MPQYKNLYPTGLIVPYYGLSAPNGWALCDGKDVYVAGIMQHIEEAGIHSGDSACCLPPISIKPN